MIRDKEEFHPVGDAFPGDGAEFRVFLEMHIFSVSIEDSFYTPHDFVYLRLRLLGRDMLPESFLHNTDITLQSGFCQPIVLYIPVQPRNGLCLIRRFPTGLLLFPDLTVSCKESLVSRILSQLRELLLDMLHQFVMYMRDQMVSFF